MAGLMSTEQRETGDVLVCLRLCRINEKILKPLKKELEGIFPNERVIVGLGWVEGITLRHHTGAKEKRIRRLVTTLGGKIDRHRRST